MTKDLASKLREHQLSKQLVALLTQIDSLEFVGFAEEVSSLSNTKAAYLEMVSVEAQPTFKLPTNASDVEKANWLHACLEQAKIQGECYMKLFEFDVLPWVRIRILSPNSWLEALWRMPEIQSLLLLPPNTAVLLGLFKEEYYDEAYIQPLAAQS